MRWRKRYSEQGETVMESNARIVTWEDGSQHLYIGNDQIYEIGTVEITRGLSDVYNVQRDNVASFLAPLGKRMKVKPVKEAATYVRETTKKKNRVRYVGATGKEEEQRIMQEEDARRFFSRAIFFIVFPKCLFSLSLRSKSMLRRAKEKRARATSAQALTADFLEEGLEEQGMEPGFVVDDDEEVSRGTKRLRGDVDEGSILAARTSQGTLFASLDFCFCVF